METDSGDLPLIPVRLCSSLFLLLLRESSSSKGSSLEASGRNQHRW